MPPFESTSSLSEVKKDPKQELSLDEGLRFDALGTWRNTRATHEGKPAYVLLTNRQLAAIAKRNPTTLTALGEVSGVGESKIRDFGTGLLAILAAAQATAYIISLDPVRRHLQNDLEVLPYQIFIALLWAGEIF